MWPQKKKIEYLQVYQYWKENIIWGEFPLPLCEHLSKSQTNEVGSKAQELGSLYRQL